MALLKIAKMGHPVLLREAVAVADPTAPEIVSLVSDMLETMHDARGAGLAAPQVHRALRLFVYHVPISRAADGEAPIAPRVLINPTITPLSDEMMNCTEGCLSLPALRGLVPRFAHVGFEGQDLEGKTISGEARGFHANVLQHENDHLDGILYTMRMKDFSSFGYVDEFTRAEDPA
ncbi:peptide deformylase [Neoasaia chiangmaiensis]|uniref:Peptide deformylase n=1 Tax=Neoasaia chiangmaiensis TaxID=320497 RepID=A0A1U9KUE6_9PROT|nr:peptide deformylase [Neoasaia chiangmaiensis]AQS89280.1 peptide deformylase [Neoasaia chiangmaiensis]GEN15836.1 peptide deformylase [Neoasaia chiangmaiensis]